jgi:hypothetical protein
MSIISKIVMKKNATKRQIELAKQIHPEVEIVIEEDESEESKDTETLDKQKNLDIRS